MACSSVSKKCLTLMFLVLTIVFSSVLTAVVVAPPSRTTIYVDPPKVAANLSETITINIEVVDVTNLYAWGLWLSWYAPLLRCDGATEGPFLKSGGGSTFWAPPKIDNVKGEVYLSCTLIGAVPTVSGSGTLATITLYVRGIGECVLDMYDTKLLTPIPNPTPPPETILAEVPHTVEDGYFYTPVTLWYADLIHRKAWPDKHHFVIAKHGDNNTLYALVRNLGTQDVWVKVKFTIVSISGKIITYETKPYLLTLAEGDTTLSVDFEAAKYGPDRYIVEAQCFYDCNGDGSPDTGTKVKTFSFSVV